MHCSSNFSKGRCSVVRFSFLSFVFLLTAEMCVLFPFFLTLKLLKAGASNLFKQQAKTSWFQSSVGQIAFMVCQQWGGFVCTHAGTKQLGTVLSSPPLLCFPVPSLMLGCEHSFQPDGNYTGSRQLRATPMLAAAAGICPQLHSPPTFSCIHTAATGKLHPQCCCFSLSPPPHPNCSSGATRRCPALAWFPTSWKLRSHYSWETGVKM